MSRKELANVVHDTAKDESHVSIDFWNVADELRKLLPLGISFDTLQFIYDNDCGALAFGGYIPDDIESFRQRLRRRNTGMLVARIGHSHSEACNRQIEAATCRQPFKPLLDWDCSVADRLDGLAEVVGLSAHHIYWEVLDAGVQVCGSQRERRFSYPAIAENKNLPAR
jgi:hypothetical protein